MTQDLAAYQRMMDRVDRLRRGENVPSVPVEDVRALITGFRFARIIDGDNSLTLSTSAVGTQPEG